MRKVPDKKTIEKVFSGELYDPASPELVAFQERLRKNVDRYNKTTGGGFGIRKRRKLLKKIFKENGDSAYINPPFHANWGCYKVKLGKNFFSNFNLTLVDDGVIEIGDDVLFGPNVTIVTASHPLHPDIRAQGVEYNKGIKIGSRVWLGANVTVLPGVNIGEGSVIGAGSVVTKDIPPFSLAYGVPAKLVRKIDESDLETYDHDKKIPAEFRKK